MRSPTNNKHLIENNNDKKNELNMAMINDTELRKHE